MKEYHTNPVKAKPNYCVPAVLQMVLEHYGILGYDQDIIASHFQVVPDSDENDHMRWGTQIKNNTLNDFFERININLKENYIPINQFMDSFFMSEKIKDLLANDVTIICGYNYTWLFGKREDTYRHVSIIVDVDLDKDLVKLLDPGPKNHGYKYVSADKLFYAIKAGRDGLWCITKK